MPSLRVVKRKAVPTTRELTLVRSVLVQHLPVPLERRKKHLPALFAVATVALLVLILFLTTLQWTISTVTVGAKRAVSSSKKAVPTAPSLVSKSIPTEPMSGASKVLVRVSQVDPVQYNSMQEYTTWWPSACSAASMTEVINSYGHNYRVTDILKVETSVGEITSDAGLLHPYGLDKTLARFNFTTHWLGDPTVRPAHPSVDNLLAVANSGTPVIINFPPDRWAGGHLLVVIGGNKDYVYLADSSRLDMRAMDHTTFLKYWVGFAVVAIPAYSVLGTPTLSPDFINRVLSAHNSPASGKGQTLYNLGVKYGIDPAFALAFFGHESSFGKNGEARSSFSLGNLRCIPTTVCKDNYAWFPTWEAGFEAWYKLIHDLYVNAWGLTTIDQIIPRYAPPADNNNDDAYIASLKLSLNTWHTGQI